MSANTAWQRASAQIIERVDLEKSYRELGVDITDSKPNANGWLACRSIGREDRNPSAGINISSGKLRGRYKDFESGESIGLFDFAAKYGPYKDWKDARRHYAKEAGVKLPGGSAPDRISERLEIQTYNEGLASIWCGHKKGIEPWALRAAGGELAKHLKKFGDPDLVIAMPYYQHAELLDADPTGYSMWHRGGRQLEVFQGKGAKVKTVPVKSIGPAGMMGAHGLHRLAAAEVIWKTEGPTDMLALMSAIPEELRETHVVITNSSGCGEKPRDEFLEHLLGKKVYVLHDADVPGQAGADVWSRAIADYAAEVRNVQLGYEITEKHGKDIRDWFNDGLGDYAKLLSIAETMPVVERSEPDEPDEPAIPLAEPAAVKKEKDKRAALHPHEHVMKAIELEVIGELDDGHVKVFSHHHRKTEIIKDVSRLTYQRMLQICGPPASRSITEAEEKESNSHFTMKEVKNAISFIAGYTRIKDDTEVGIGVWPGKSSTVEEGDSVILVGAGEAVRLNGKPELERFYSPRADGLLLDLGSSTPWYDYELLAKNVELAAGQKEWGISVIEGAANFFNQWNWGKYQATMPITIVGLIMATWVQTFWKWRPQVGITGQSHSGKTWLLDSLDLIFGSLGMKSEKSSEPGLRQHVRNTSRVILCDEFESSRERQKILDWFKTGGRGGRILKGTAGQQGASYGLRHIPWMAAIEFGLDREPDRNRFIILECLKAKDGEFGKLQMNEEKLHQMGQELLALALVHIRDAVGVAEKLKSTTIPGADKRVIESYASPAAILSCAQYQDFVGAIANLNYLMRAVERDEHGHADHDDLIASILSSTVDCGRGEKHSVSQILGSDQLYVDHRDQLARHGIGLVSTSHNSRADPDHIFFAHTIIRKMLLRGEEWGQKNIDQILKRMPGAEHEGVRHRIACVNTRGVRLPLEQFMAEYFNDEATECF